MKEFWRSRANLLTRLLIFVLCLQNLTLCSSLNFEGAASLRFKEKVGNDPPYGASSSSIDGVGIDTSCFRTGVGCSDGFLADLNSQEKRVLMGRKLLQGTPRPLRRGWNFDRLPQPVMRNSPSPAPGPSPSFPIPFASSPSSSYFPVIRLSPPAFSNPLEQPGTPAQSSHKNHHQLLVLYPAIGAPLVLLLFLVGCFFYLRRRKFASVRPWDSGLSGPFITGVPNFQRSELEAACEDFSNVIGSSSVCTLYKGILSTRAEIAVASIELESSKDWTSGLEAQFREKVETLSKINHKNFISLLGYCEEEKPFTRMMVFEYAPNGTLFEHLHVIESERLDWQIRLRIAMGIAYCLERMHQLTPPLAHSNLKSSSVYLSDDNAAKLADFVFWDEAATEPNLSRNVYSFGLVLFEMITGKLPVEVSKCDDDSLLEWASDYFRGTQPLSDLVDPTLKKYQEDQLGPIDELIRSCVNPDWKQRPVMKEVCLKLREITGIKPHMAVPMSSPLWWAELQILST